MTPQQQSALEGLISRPLTPDEIAALDTFVAARNDVQIAAILTAGRTKSPRFDHG